MSSAFKNNLNYSTIWIHFLVFIPRVVITSCLEYVQDIVRILMDSNPISFLIHLQSPTLQITNISALDSSHTSFGMWIPKLCCCSEASVDLHWITAESLFYCVYWEIVSLSGCPGTHLSLPVKCWDQRHAPSYQMYKWFSFTLFHLPCHWNGVRTLGEPQSFSTGAWKQGLLG